MATLVPIVAYAFADTIRLTEMADVFVGATVLRDANRDRMLASWPSPQGTGLGPDGGTRLAFLFDFGAVVFAGLPREECEKQAQAVLARLPAEPHAPLTEDFLVEIRPGAEVEVQFDRVILPEPAVAMLDIVALLVAQSAAMDYFEEDVRDILARTERITRSLHQHGRLPGRIRALARFVGSCMTTRSDIVESLALFDKPESTWERPELDRLYLGLRTELEIDDRFRSLEARLRVMQDNLVLILDLVQNRSAWRLEFIIVVLILFEIALSLWTMGSPH